MHAFMHYHMTKHAQWNRKIIQICSNKIQFYIILHFYFFMKQCTTNFSKLSSFKLMPLSVRTFLNIDSSTSHEVIGVYLVKKFGAKWVYTKFYCSFRTCYFFCLFFQIFGLPLDLHILSLFLFLSNLYHS